MASSWDYPKDCVLFDEGMVDLAKGITPPPARRSTPPLSKQTNTPCASAHGPRESGR